MVFQDPYQSLNPRMTRRRAGAGAAAHAGHVAQRRACCGAATALEDAGLAPAERFWDRFPHELSGGQRQRVVIASALAPEPDGLVCDEPVSALDVSVRAQVLHLLLDLRRARGLALLLITHDVGLAWALCDRVAVMYLGRIVELGAAERRARRPQHPYTKALSRWPRARARARPAARRSSPASCRTPRRIPAGCRFHPRCPRARERCAAEDVALRPSGAAGQTAACWYPGPEG